MARTQTDNVLSNTQAGNIKHKRTYSHPILKLLYIENGLEEKMAAVRLEEITSRLLDITCVFTVVSNCFTALEACEITDFDAIFIADTGLVHLNAFDFLRVFRSVGAIAPVFLLTSSEENYERITIEDYFVNGSKVKKFQYYDPPRFNGKLRRPYTKKELCSCLGQLFQSLQSQHLVPPSHGIGTNSALSGGFMEGITHSAMNTESRLNSFSESNAALLFEPNLNLFSSSTISPTSTELHATVNESTRRVHRISVDRTTSETDDNSLLPGPYLVSGFAHPHRNDTYSQGIVTNALVFDQNEQSYPQQLSRNLSPRAAGNGSYLMHFVQSNTVSSLNSPTAMHSNNSGISRKLSRTQSMTNASSASSSRGQAHGCYTTQPSSSADTDSSNSRLAAASHVSLSTPLASITSSSGASSGNQLTFTSSASNMYGLTRTNSNMFTTHINASSNAANSLTSMGNLLALAESNTTNTNTITNTAAGLSTIPLITVHHPTIEENTSTNTNSGNSLAILDQLVIDDPTTIHVTGCSNNHKQEKARTKHKTASSRARANSWYRPQADNDNDSEGSSDCEGDEEADFDDSRSAGVVTVFSSAGKAYAATSSTLEVMMMPIYSEPLTSDLSQHDHELHSSGRPSPSPYNFQAHPRDALVAVDSDSSQSIVARQDNLANRSNSVTSEITGRTKRPYNRKAPSVVKRTNSSGKKTTSQTSSSRNKNSSRSIPNYLSSSDSHEG